MPKISPQVKADFEATREQPNKRTARPAPEAALRGGGKLRLKEAAATTERNLKHNRRNRRTVQQYHAKRNDVSEVYSPPRMATAAKRAGLQPGWSLDLTTFDDDGTPWDLSKPEKQNKARHMVLTDQPALLIACPLCSPFSTLQN